MLKVPFVVLALVSVTAEAATPSFSKSKKKMSGVYQAHPVSFYCGCEFSYSGRKLVPDLKSCAYEPRKNAKRAKRIEWEHVVPAWAFGHQLQCWQQGGRKGCRKDQRFREMEADMHNLVPAVGEVNGDRSNYSFAMLVGEARRYGQCDFEIDFKQRKAEPPENRRGDIARTYFYMRDRYGLKISRKQQQLFRAWAKQDPVDAWEITRNEEVSKLQGNSNPYVVQESEVSLRKAFEQ